MDNQVCVGIRAIVLNHSLEARKKAPGIYTNKSVDADIAYIGFSAIQFITDVAVFFNILPTWAIVEFLTYFDTDERPLSPRRIEVTCV